MKRVLLVEDSITSARIVLRALNSIGISVELQAGAKGARSACEGRPFDAYVVDLSIREDERGGTSDGMDFVRWILLRRPSAKIVVCSSDEGRAEEARSIGCRFVVKGPELGRRIVEALLG